MFVIVKVVRSATVYRNALVKTVARPPETLYRGALVESPVEPGLRTKAVVAAIC